MPKSKKKGIDSIYSHKHAKKYLFWIILAALIVLSYQILEPFLVSIITAFFLAYLVKPIHDKLSKKMPKHFSATIAVLLIVLILFLPFAFLIGGLTQQALSFVNPSETSRVVEKIIANPIIENNFPRFTDALREILKGAINWLVSVFTSAFKQIPSLAMSLLIIVLGTYYTLTNWTTLSKNLKAYLPVKDKNALADELSKSTNNIVYGSFLIAFIQFIFAAIAFYLIGVKSWIFLPVLIFFFAFIPGLGPIAVWVPMDIYYFITQDYISLIWMTIAGLILTVGIDTILRGKLIGDKSKINPFILLVGLIGGISLFGIFGFIIGPLVLVYTIRILKEVLDHD